MKPAIKFVVVNGRTPRPLDRCAFCCTAIQEGYVRDLASRFAYCRHACWVAHGRAAAMHDRSARKAS